LPILLPNPDKPEITNHKLQIPNTKELNSFNFSSIDEDIFSNSFAFLQDYLLVCFFVFLVIGICLLFEICHLEFPLSQLLHEWIRKSLAIKGKKITNKILISIVFLL